MRGEVAGVRGVWCGWEFGNGCGAKAWERVWKVWKVCGNGCAPQRCVGGVGVFRNGCRRPRLGSVCGRCVEELVCGNGCCSACEVGGRVGGGVVGVRAGGEVEGVR